MSSKMDADCKGIMFNDLSAEKDRVFEEVSRVLKPDGRLALSDIISEERMPDNIKTNADLRAACIGGAEQVDDWR